MEYLTSLCLSRWKDLLNFLFVLIVRLITHFLVHAFTLTTLKMDLYWRLQLYEIHSASIIIIILISFFGDLDFGKFSLFPSFKQIPQVFPECHLHFLMPPLYWKRLFFSCFSKDFLFPLNITPSIFHFVCALSIFGCRVLEKVSSDLKST